MSRDGRPWLVFGEANIEQGLEPEGVETWRAWRMPVACMVELVEVGML
jgi:hypothetical protein